MAINKHTSYTCKKNPDNTYSMVVKCRVNGKDVDATGTLTQTELESLAATHVKVDCQNGLRGQANTPDKWWYGADSTKESTPEYIARRKREGATKEEIWDELKNLVE